MRLSLVSGLFFSCALSVYAFPSDSVIRDEDHLAVARVPTADVELLPSLEERQVPTLHLGNIPLAITLPPNDILFQVGTSVKGTPAVGPDGGSSKLVETVKATCMKCFTTGRAIITTTGVKTDESALDEVFNIFKDPTEVVINALDLNLEVTFEDVSGHFEIDFQFSGSKAYTFPLFTPSSPAGVQIGDNVEGGLLFSLELIVTVTGSVDVISGFEVEFPAGSSFVLNPISGQLVEENLGGIKVKAIPAKFRSGAACVTVALRFKLKTGLSVKVPGFGAKLEAGAYIDAPQYEACVKSQPTLPCELDFEEKFYIAAAVSAEAVKEIDFATWAAGPTLARTLYKKALPSTCFISSKSAKSLPTSPTSHKITPTPPLFENTSKKRSSTRLTPTPSLSENTSKKSSSTRFTTLSRKTPSSTHTIIKSSPTSSSVKLPSSSRQSETLPFPYGSGTRSTHIKSSSSISGTRVSSGPIYTYSGVSSLGSVSGITKASSSSRFHNSTTILSTGSAPSHPYGSDVSSSSGTGKGRVSSARSTGTRPFPTYGPGFPSGIIKVASSSTLPTNSTASKPSRGASFPYSHGSGIFTGTRPVSTGSVGSIISIPSSDVLYPNSTTPTPYEPPFPTTTPSPAHELYTTISSDILIPDSDSTSTYTASQTITIDSTSTYTIYACATEAIWCPSDQLSTIILTKTLAYSTPALLPVLETTSPIRTLLPGAFSSTVEPITTASSSLLPEYESITPPPTPIHITDPFLPEFTTLPTPIIETVKSVTVYTTLNINEIAAHSPTVPQVLHGSTWYVPGQIITIPSGPGAATSGEVTSTSSFSGKGAVFTPGGYYPFGNRTVSGGATGSGVGTGTASGTGVGTGTGTGFSGTGFQGYYTSKTAWGTSRMASGSGTTVGSGPSPSAYRPRPGAGSDWYKGGVGLEARGGGENMVKSSGAAASVGVSAVLLVLGFLGVLVGL